MANQLQHQNQTLEERIQAIKNYEIKMQSLINEDNNLYRISQEIKDELKKYFENVFLKKLETLAFNFSSILQDSLNELHTILLKKFNDPEVGLNSHDYFVLNETLRLVNQLQDENQTIKQKIQTVERYAIKMLPLQAVSDELLQRTLKIVLISSGILLLGAIAGILSVTYIPVIPLMIMMTLLAVGGVLASASVPHVICTLAANMYSFFKATPMDDAIESIALDAKRARLAEPATPRSKQCLPCY